MFQKQPSRGVLRKRCSGNMQQIYRGTPKVAKQLYWNRTSVWMFSCNFCCIFLEHLFPRIPWRAASDVLLLLIRRNSLNLLTVLLIHRYKTKLKEERKPRKKSTGSVMINTFFNISLRPEDILHHLFKFYNACAVLKVAIT